MVFGQLTKKDMDTKPVKPRLHGIIDYVFSGIQVAVPLLLGLNKKAATTYGALGTGFLAVNALTDTPAGLKHLLSFRKHQKADQSFLAGLSLLSFVDFIRKDRKALIFHFGFLTAAIAHYILTDYNANKLRSV